MIQKIKQKCKFIGLLLILCVVGCDQQKTEKPSLYPVLDSGVTASTKYGDNIYWMDNDRVMFVSYGPKPKTVEEQRQHKPSIYIWDTRINKVEKYADGSALCYHDGYIRYAFYGTDIPKVDPELSHRTFWKEGVFGNETIKTAEFATVEEYRAWYHANPLNPYTCRLIKKPEFMIGKVWLPLLEQHGVLEWETDTIPGATKSEQPVLFRRSSDNKAIPLKITRGDIALTTRRYYMKQRDSYFFQEPINGEIVQKNDCIRYWWMSNKGYVEAGCQSIVPVKNVSKYGVSLYPTKKGVLVSAGKANDYDAGTLALYLVSSNEYQKIITGGHEKLSLSPNGCNLAFVNTPFYMARRVGSPGESRLKIINLCSNGGNENE